jgi:hypothetical protein
VAARKAQADARRVVEVGDDVEELCARPKRGLQGIGDKAFGVGRHGRVADPVGVEGAERAHVGRRAHRHEGAGVAEALGDQVEPLLRPGDDLHVLARGSREARRHPVA